MLVNKRKIRKTVFIIASCAIVIYVSNYTFLNLFLSREYTYSNFDGSFKFKEYRFKGGSYIGAKSSYSYFLKDHPDVKDKQLYRTFWIAPWEFWEWNQYIGNNERFKLPYISESEIAKNRDIQKLID